LERANEPFLSADTDQSDLVPWNEHSPKIESETTCSSCRLCSWIGCSRMQSISQWTCSSGAL